MNYNQKVYCTCGCKITRANIAKHRTSKKHALMMHNIEAGRYCQIAEQKQRTQEYVDWCVKTGRFDELKRDWEAKQKLEN